MEDTLRDGFYIEKYIYKSLNPCFNGRYSQRVINKVSAKDIICLNPCFNGRYSQSVASKENRNGVKVLILVLMEDTLRVAITRFSRVCMMS